MAASVAGLLLAFTVRCRTDAHLAAYAVVAFVIGASFRVAINRYVCTVAPILLLLGLVATKLGIEHIGRRSPWSSWSSPRDGWWSTQVARSTASAERSWRAAYRSKRAFSSFEQKIHFTRACSSINSVRTRCQLRASSNW